MEILEERAHSSRGLRKPRGVKRKMSNYPLRKRGPLTTNRIEFKDHIMIIK